MVPPRARNAHRARAHHPCHPLPSSPASYRPIPPEYILGVPRLLAQLDHRLRLLVAGASLVIIMAGIRAASGLLDSVLLALLLTIAVLPVYQALRDRGRSNFFALLATTAMLIVATVALLGFVGVAGTQLVRTLPAYQAKVDGLRVALEMLLEERGIDSARVLSLEIINPNRLLPMVAGFMSGAGQVLSRTILLILIVAFILLEAGSRGFKLDPGDRVGQAARDIRHYLVITTATGAVFAVFAYILLLSLGTDLALVWAVLAFVMNFVPNVGIILSIIPPALLTLLEYNGQRALVVVAGYIAVNFVIDNIIKPKFMADELDVSPLTGLLSLIVWTFLLGPTGALLAIPLTLALRRLLQEEPLTLVGPDHPV